MKLLLAFLFLLVSFVSYSQGYNHDKIALTNFLKRMIQAESFEGVRLVDDYYNEYLISVVWLDPSVYSTTFEMNRVAQVKAQSQALRYLQGSIIESEFVVLTHEIVNGDSIRTHTETIERIQENAAGFSRGLESFTRYNEGDIKIYIFGRIIDD